ncbi:hypothetical protein BDV11DRAFT_186870, partial [Aspergillus similis]
MITYMCFIMINEMCSLLAAVLFSYLPASFLPFQPALMFCHIIVHLKALKGIDCILPEGIRPSVRKAARTKTGHSIRIVSQSSYL